MSLSFEAELKGVIAASEHTGLQAYLESGSNHRSYKHYARRDKILSILDSGHIYLSDGSSWNDTIDGRAFNNPSASRKNFGLCFSWSSVESVAMWMLYGGRGKDGAMIDFPRNALKFDNPIFNEVGLGKFVARNFESLCTVGAENIQIDLMDILYLDTFNDRQDHMRLFFQSGRKSFLIARSSVNALPHAIIKSKSWEYEQEVRLIVSVPKSLLGDHVEDITHLRLPISTNEVLNTGRVYRSPLCDTPTDFTPSSLTGLVDWDLCENCEWSMADGVRN